MTDAALLDSYAYCHRLMRRAARNFYFGMRLLPPAKRNAMYALYTFMRMIDDVADDPGANKHEALENVRRSTHNALQGRLPDHALWPALADAVHRFSIPLKVFDDAIDGQLQDLTTSTYQTFEQLYQYCYRVASTVGIAALHVWGYQDPQAEKLAEYRGIAMQLTNIIRDLREDAIRGRCYLPADECDRFNCCACSFSSPSVPAGYDDLMSFQIGRARRYYDDSEPLESLVSADSRPTLRTMTAIYRGILDRIAADPRRVLRGRVRLSAWAKYSIVLRNTWGRNRRS